jgi:hypothetical protein
MELNYWFVNRCYSVAAREHNNSTTSEIQLDEIRRQSVPIHRLDAATIVSGLSVWRAIFN